MGSPYWCGGVPLFRDYLRRRRGSDTPAGDLARRMLDDGRMPDVRSWGDLATHLRLRGTPAPVLEAAHRVWKGYGSAARHGRSYEPGPGEDPPAEPSP